MKCKFCGSNVADGDVFCGTCGNLIERKEESPAPPREEFERNPPRRYRPEEQTTVGYFDPRNPRQPYNSGYGRNDTPLYTPPQAVPKKNNGLIVGIVIGVIILGIGIGVGTYFLLNYLGEKKNPTDPAQDEAEASQVVQTIDEDPDEDSDNKVYNYANAEDKKQNTDTAASDESEPAETDEGVMYYPTALSHFSSDFLPSNIERANTYFDYRPRIVKADASVTLRSGPRTSSSKEDSVAKKSLVYEVAVSADGEWSLIYYRYYNKYGWIANRFLIELTDVNINEQDLYSGSVEINGKTIRVGEVSKHQYRVREDYGLILRDADNKNGEWIMRMEDGDSITEICRSKNNPEWGYVEYNDGVKAYRGFAHSDYYG